MANQDSIFYKIGAQVRESINDSISSVPQLNGDNLFYGANKFYGNTQIGSQTGFKLTASTVNKIQIYGINNAQTYNQYQVLKTALPSATSSSVSFNSASNELTISLNSDNTTETLADLVTIINSTLPLDFYAFVIDPSTSSELSNTIDAVSLTDFFATNGGKLTVVNDATFSNNLSINGNLIVTGTTTTLTSSELQIEDNFITLSKGAGLSSDYWRDSGLYFERANTLNNTAFLWDESAEEFVLGEISSSGVQYHTMITTGTNSGFKFFGEDVTSSSGSGQVVSTGINGDNQSEIDLKVGDSLRFTFNIPGGDSYELQDADNKVIDLVQDDGTIVQSFSTASGTPILNFTPTSIGNYTLYYVSGATAGLIISVTAATPTNDAHDVFNIDPGALKVGSLSITDAVHGQLDLGDLSDFTAGLGS
jgi:hypothetical protein